MCNVCYLFVISMNENINKSVFYNKYQRKYLHEENRITAIFFAFPYPQVYCFVFLYFLFCTITIQKAICFLRDTHKLPSWMLLCIIFFCFCRFTAFVCTHTLCILKSLFAVDCHSIF